MPTDGSICTGNRSAATAITALSASETATLIRSKELSPVEVLSAYVERIFRIEPKIHAFASLAIEAAMAEARHAETAMMLNENVGPLLGVPITVKSCINAAGLPCEAGSRLRRGYIAREDATCVARLKRAGAIILGNTSTPEMLMAYHTENDISGRTNNPWSLDRTAGGSSGGEAAAIAAGMSAAGIGSDGGGSIRVPAHFCGICGLKPTPGRVPATGHYPAAYGPFAFTGVIGPMARTVADLRLLLDVMSGYDRGDSASSSAPLESIGADQAKSLRVGYYDDDGYNPATPEVRAAVRLSANILADAGFAVQPFSPRELGKARELWSNIFVDAGALLVHGAIKDREQEVSDGLKDFLNFAAGRPPLTADTLLNTLIERDQLRLRLLAAMEQFPILLAPVCSVSAFKHEDAGWGESHAADYQRTMSYCQHYNLLGNPAAVVPVAQSSEGLPIGVQIIGRPYRENEILAAAEVLEAACGWKEPRL
jgi:Asp-tRNA(Asn)/Glu-tRNA(Gln) amidotransferase A subunit family amidase